MGGVCHLAPVVATGRAHVSRAIAHQSGSRRVSYASRAFPAEGAARVPLGLSTRRAAAAHSTLFPQVARKGGRHASLDGGSAGFGDRGADRMRKLAYLLLACLLASCGDIDDDQAKVHIVNALYGYDTLDLVVGSKVKVEDLPY